MKTFAFSSTLFVDAETEEEASEIFKTQADDFVHEAEIEEV